MSVSSKVDVEVPAAVFFFLVARGDLLGGVGVADRFTFSGDALRVVAGGDGVGSLLKTLPDAVGRGAGSMSSLSSTLR